MVELVSIYKDRAIYSQTRLQELGNRIAKIPGLSDYTSSTIFSAGSYARHEACKHSDIDMFFLCKKEREYLSEPHTNELRIFGKLIDIVDEMSFPKFSNDCQYLKILHSPQILEHIGSSIDDQENFFTVRMLLLLESKCLYRDDIYNDIIKEIVGSYYKD